MSRLKSVKLRFVRVFLTFSSFLISCCSPALPERIMWPTRVFSLFQIYQNQLCTQKKSHSSWWFDYVILSDVALHLGDYTFPALLGLAASIIWSLFCFLGLNANVLNCRLWMKLSLFFFFFFVLMVYFGVKPLSHTSAGQELQSESVFSARISRSVETVAFKHTWMSGDALVFVFCIQGIKVMPLGWKKTAVCTVL